jgi:CAAX protease family protein
VHYSLALITPIVLTLSTALVFYFGAIRLGKKMGYLAGFLFYWSIWCLLLPLISISQEKVKALLKPVWPTNGQYPWLNLIFLIIPLGFAYGYAFPKALKKATVSIIVFSLLLSIVNACLEEFLWRGLYYEWLGSRPIQYVLISSLGFSIWHLSPQIIFPNQAPGAG